MTRPYLAELSKFITVKYKLQKREKHKKGGCHHHSKYISGGKITNHLQEKSECLQLKWAAGLGGAKSRKIKTAILSLAPGMLAGLFPHRIVSRPRCTCFMFYMSAWWQKDCVRCLASWSARAFKQLSCQSQVQDHSSHQPQTKSLLKISKNILTFL